MADSDDEYDRKRRDKFRGERGAAEGSSYRSSDRREERSRGRDEWSERSRPHPVEPSKFQIHVPKAIKRNSIALVARSRGGRSGPDYRDYRGGASASRGYSPVRGEGPPSKRIRPEWPVEDRRYGGMPHDSYGSYGWAHDHFGPHPAHQGYGQPMPPVPASPNSQSRSSINSSQLYQMHVWDSTQSQMEVSSTRGRIKVSCPSGGSAEPERFFPHYSWDLLENLNQQDFSTFGGINPNMQRHVTASPKVERPFKDSVIPGPGSLTFGSDHENEGGDIAFGTPLETPLVSEKQPHKSESGQQRLCGAARKRLRRLVNDAGLDMEEALSLCRTPWSQLISEKPFLKRIHKLDQSEEESPKENQSENVKTSSTPKERTVPPDSCKDVMDAARVGIRNSEPMTMEQMNMVHDALVRTLGRKRNHIENKGRGPRFLGFTCKTGWMLITCRNHEGQEWLFKVVPGLKPWPEARLSLMDESEMPKPWVAETFIPSPEASPISRALNMIWFQNPGLNPEYWRVLNEKAEETGTWVTFSLDEPSVETLQANNFQVGIGLRNVLFRLKGEQLTPTARTALRVSHRLHPAMS